MLKTVVSTELPVGEVLYIRKQSLKNGLGLRRISIVTGSHGDELEGQYVCYELIRQIEAEKEKLNGTVDIYPALNPLGIDSNMRSIPFFDVDLNRQFPGNRERALPSVMANGIIRDLRGSDLCIDIHASNVFLREAPQVRINRMNKDVLVPLASRINMDFIWIHEASTVLESTLAHSMNSAGVPTLVVEMGVGMRLTREYCDQLVEGIFVLLKDFGIWEGDVITPKEAIISEDSDEISFLNSPGPGVFVPTVTHGVQLNVGDEVGHIVNPFTGKIDYSLFSEVDGWLFTLREFPNVYEGSLVARILRRSV